MPANPNPENTTLKEDLVAVEEVELHHHDTPYGALYNIVQKAVVVDAPPLNFQPTKSAGLLLRNLI